MNEIEIIDAIKSGSGRVYGGGTRRGGNWSASSHCGVIMYSPDELTITVKAGTAIEEIESVIAKHHQMLGFEPMDHRVILGREGTPTIGGALGVDADGPRRLRLGSMRDALLGLRFMDGRGEIIRAGGRVMKNVTGLDITRLFAGSNGSLGVALDVSLKLLPRPSAQHIAAYEMSYVDAAKVMGRVLLMPLEISGVIYSAGQLIIRQEANVMAPLRARLENEIGKGRAIDEASWRALRDWDMLKNHNEIWRVYLRPSQALEFLHELDLPYMVLCGGAQIVVAGSLLTLQNRLENGIFARCEKGATMGARAPSLPASTQALAHKIREVFDPHARFGSPHEN